MNKIHKITLTATIALAILLTLSCGSDDGDEVGGNSSSSGGGSEACGDVTIGSGTMTCAGQTYKTVVIGMQTWMAENLDYKTENSWCYDDDLDNCTKYGRLYDWATAMALPSTCNNTVSTENECKINSPHKGICPTGYHIPSFDDWKELLNAVDNSSIAGVLRSATGWYNCGPTGSGKSYVCEDTFGFSALPGGFRYGSPYNPSYSNANGEGYWWVADASSTDPSRAFRLYMGDHGGLSSALVKSYGYSVRCVQD